VFHRQQNQSPLTILFPWPEVLRISQRFLKESSRGA
jgi:hypothetical protein